MTKKVQRAKTLQKRLASLTREIILLKITEVETPSLKSKEI